MHVRIIPKPIARLCNWAGIKSTGSRCPTYDISPGSNRTHSMQKYAIWLPTINGLCAVHAYVGVDLKRSLQHSFLFQSFKVVFQLSPCMSNHLDLFPRIVIKMMAKHY